MKNFILGLLSVFILATSFAQVPAKIKGSQLPIYPVAPPIGGYALYWDSISGLTYRIPAANLGPATIIDVAKKYGIVADGVTDNTTRLMQLRTDCMGYGKPYYIFLWPQGTITYTDNRWINNIVNFTFIGSGIGTVFRNTYTGSDEKFWRPLWQGELWQTNTMAYIGTVTYTTNYKFNTVNAGSRTVTCTTTSDATLIAAIIAANGNRILLWAEDQVGNGFPPGTRKNEFHEVDSVNTTTGVIYLRKALKNSYSTAVWDVPDIVGTGSAGGSGLPRITMLDRADYIFPHFCEFKNVRFGNPLDASHVIRPTASGTFQIIGNYVKTDHVTVEGHFWPSQSQYQYHQFLDVVANPANFASEFDKVVETVICEDSHFRNSVSNATGIETVRFDRCTFDESVQLCPRFLSIKNSTLRGAFYPDGNPSVGLYGAPAANPIRILELQNNTYTRSSTNTSEMAMNIAPLMDDTIRAVSGNNIIIPFRHTLPDTGWMSTDAVKFYTMEEGYTRMFKNDGSKQGIITSRTWDGTYNSGQGAFVISGTWNVAPVVGEVWKHSPVAQINDLGGHKVNAPFASKFPMYGDNMILKLSSGEKNKIALNEKCFDYTGTDHIIDFGAQFVEFDIKVNKPYNGTDAACKLFIITDPAGADIFTINLRTAGRRLLTEFAANGSKTGDALDNTKLGIFHGKIHIFIRGSSGNLSDQSEASMPLFDMTIKTTGN